MRVLHVIDHWGLGGAQRALVNLMSGRPDVNFAVAALYGHGEHPWALPKDVDFRCLAKSYGQTRAAVRGLRQFIKSWQPDLIQVHLTGSRFVTAWALRGIKQRPPVIWYEHSGLEIFRTYGMILGRLLLFAQRRLLSKVTALAANSHHTAEFCAKHLVEANVVYCPVDVAAIRQAGASAVQAPVMAEKQSPVIGFVGRLAEQKNPRHFVDAAQILASKQPDVRFWVVGSGPLSEVMQQWVQQAGLTEAFTLWGSREDVYALMAQMDAVVMPSRFEPFGLVACEAFSLGVPVVGYAVDGLVELLAGHDLGFPVEPDNPRDLADAIEKALTNKSRDSKLPEPLRQANADAWIDHYRRVLGLHPAEVAV